MKKQLLAALLCAAAIIPLTSCGNDGITSMLNDLSNGFKMTGTMKQNAIWLDPYTGEPSGDVDTNSYNLEYYYQNSGDITGVSQFVSYYDAETKKDIYMSDETYIKGNDGFTYFYELGYKNKLEAIAAVDSVGNNVNYDFYFDNPFSHILAKDFTKIDGNTYSLVKSKAFYLSYMLFSRIDPVFYEVVDSANFVIEGNTLKSATIKPIQIMDYVTIENVIRYYILETIVEVQFEDAGKATIKTPELREYHDYHAPLKNALETINNNYTLKITHTSAINENGGTNVFTFYYTPTYIYWQCGENDTISVDNDVILKVVDSSQTVIPMVYDDINGNWSANKATNYAQIKGASVDLFLPEINDVAAEIFDYNGQSMTYTPNSYILPYLASECFVPLVLTTQELNGYTTDFVVSLDKGNLKTINISYSYNNGWDVYHGNYILEFSNIGSTVLPFGIEL